MDPMEISGFMRSLAHAVAASQQRDLRSINRRLRSSGWVDVALDDHTLQLFLASYELEEGFSGIHGQRGFPPQDRQRERMVRDESAFPI
jgi:hypothetical protein